MNRQTQVVRAFGGEQCRDSIRLAARVICAGGLVVMPTETVYGIGANALDEEAVAGIFAAKGRPQDNPLIVHIARREELYRLARRVPAAAEKLVERFWPGPLTIILPKGELIPPSVSAGLDTVALRMPCHPVARGILLESGLPVAAPSANLSGKPSPTTAEHCVEDLMGRVDLIVDGGPCDVGVESTVVTLEGPVPRLLRPGGVTREELREALGELEVDKAVNSQIDESAPVSSPGMKYKHYAPKATVVLVHADFPRFASFVAEKAGEGVFALAFDEDLPRLTVPCVGYGGEDDPAGQARQLFGALRELDARGAKDVYARSPSPRGLGLAVYNRLVRAAAFREITL